MVVEISHLKRVLADKYRLKRRREWRYYISQSKDGSLKQYNNREFLFNQMMIQNDGKIRTNGNIFKYELN